MSDEDSIATVRISHIGLFWNRDLVQRYAFPGFSDIFRCFARQEHDCSSAVHPLPHCIIQLTHIQKVVTKEQGLQLQIYSTRGLTPMWPNALSGLYLISTVPLQKPRFYAVSRACFYRYLSEYSDNSRFSCMLTFWTYLMRCT